MGCVPLPDKDTNFSLVRDRISLYTVGASRFGVLIGQGHSSYLPIGASEPV